MGRIIVALLLSALLTPSACFGFGLYPMQMGGAPQYSYGSELITNSGFNTDLTGWTTGGLTPTATTSDPYEGARSFQMVHSGATGWCGAKQAITVPTAETTYLVSGAATMIAAVGDTLTLNVTETVGGSGELVSEIYADNTTSPWALKSKIFIKPSGVTEIEVGCGDFNNCANSTFKCDVISLKERIEI